MVNPTTLIIQNDRALNIFKEYCRDRSSAVLDVGSGNDHFLHQLKAEGFRELHGVDFNPPPDSPISKKSNICYEPLLFANDYFGAVTAWELMEHLENPYIVIREIGRVLKPGGLFIFSMPNIFHWSNKIWFALYGNILRYTKKNDHRTILTHDLFEKAIGGEFELIGVKYCVPVFWPAKVRGFPWGRINLIARRFEYLFPENRLFSHFVIYVLKRK